ncbi:glycoside hydrolase family 6 protein [Cryobacterium sp. PAMC25264]|uniref:glycoside hydrolase family 6 protein n=1 Tax=Cryobacterium sp. PAMC25264 TaxID=2861288 RepID=UPI001C63453E|nr:glycoside hydrolase family 6 protein [Cryobacterium sp. PAMC25264]QYF73716.1 glycoside hydrolase family 6 protein [Cryobacterium sp. PAMC25264]
MESTGSRLGLSLGIIALAAPIVALGLFIGSFAITAVEAARSNPLAGATFYTNPDSTARKAAAAAAEADPGSADAATLTRLADQPAATWLLPEKYPMDTVRADVAAIADAAAAAGQLPVFVIYGIPDRDCGNFSTGGLSESDYPIWVESIATALDTRAAVVILEPDALALAQQCGNVPQRVAQIQQGVAALQGTLATVYLDAGHSDWLDAATAANLLNQAGVQNVRGFATNVSNYNDSAAEQAFGEAVSALTNGAHFIVDTSRNGVGSNGEWCNPTGRALGATPEATSDDGLRDANLWVKEPGESDGTCNNGPAAGEWWPERALELANAAGW